MKNRNKNGLYGFGFGLASAFFYEFLIFQFMAVYFSYKGYTDSKGNSMLSKWEYRGGFILGIIYLGMFVLKLVSPNI
jgi:hypothetical protein